MQMQHVCIHPARSVRTTCSGCSAYLLHMQHIYSACSACTACIPCACSVGAACMHHMLATRLLQRALSPQPTYVGVPSPQPSQVSLSPQPSHVGGIGGINNQVPQFTLSLQPSVSPPAAPPPGAIQLATYTDTGQPAAYTGTGQPTAYTTPPLSAYNTPRATATSQLLAYTDPSQQVRHRTPGQASQFAIVRGWHNYIGHTDAGS